MSQPIINYDEMSDALHVSFEPGAQATGIELNDNILLRIDKHRRKALGITFFNYSILIQKADFGPRSFPLTGIAALSNELQEMVMEIISNSPVNEFLSLSTYTPSLSEAIPITLLRLPEAQSAGV
jgi:uncharacterized protein YuzE